MRTVPTSPLLERERERAALEQALEAAAGGRGQLLLIEGPAGIGKSSLLEVAITSAGEQGLHALDARGSPLEHEFAFGVVRQLLASAPVADSREREELLTGAASLVANLAERVLNHADDGALGHWWPSYARGQRAVVGGSA